MCTAIAINGSSSVFGRTLDVECSYGERIVIAPCGSDIGARSLSHPKIIGSATVADGIPLFYDAMNEHGLCAAALNFPRSAVYLPTVKGKRNLPSFALIPTVLSECRSVDEATELLNHVNITTESFSADLPATPMHWIVSDGKFSVVAEPLADGLKVTATPYGVLTNEPHYQYHLLHLEHYCAMHPASPENRMLRYHSGEVFSGGMGAMGLPGDFSSPSRFVRAVYAREYTLSDGSEWGEVNRFFHVASCVSVPEGCSYFTDGGPSRTLYTSCFDTTHMSYYVKSYSAQSITKISLDSYECESGITEIDMPGLG